MSVRMKGGASCESRNRSHVACVCVLVSVQTLFCRRAAHAGAQIKCLRIAPFFVLMTPIWCGNVGLPPRRAKIDPSGFQSPRNVAAGAIMQPLGSHWLRRRVEAGTGVGRANAIGAWRSFVSASRGMGIVGTFPPLVLLSTTRIRRTFPTPPCWTGDAIPGVSTNECAERHRSPFRSTYGGKNHLCGWTTIRDARTAAGEGLAPLLPLRGRPRARQAAVQKREKGI